MLLDLTFVVPLPIVFSVFCFFAGPLEGLDCFLFKGKVSLTTGGSSPRFVFISSAVIYLRWRGGAFNSAEFTGVGLIISPRPVEHFLNISFELVVTIEG